MKNRILALLAILLCAMALTSCNDNLEKRILGAWTIASFDGDTQADGVGLQFSYSPDGIFTYISDEGMTVGTYTLDGRLLTMTLDETPWSLTVKKVTRSAMTWIGPETGKDVVLTRQ